MKIVLQRVKEASVTIEGNKVGEIGQGYLLLLGVSNDDTREIADKMIEKISRLRIFEDSEGNSLGATYSSGFDLPDKLCPNCNIPLYKGVVKQKS